MSPLYPIFILAALAGPFRGAGAPSGALAHEAAVNGLRPAVLRSALDAYAHAWSAGATRRQMLTVIDYSLPSSQRRLWVLDLRAGHVLARELVAHGRGTGDDVATRFSNRPGSYQSSLGAFITGGVYRGAHGPSLRLRGLDAGVNDSAEVRAIVIHGATYVSEGFVRRFGRLGRSQGCPALNPESVQRVIGLIRAGTVVFAFHSADT